MNPFFVLDPMGERSAGQITPAKRFPLKRGDSVGILCNGKPNSAPLLNRVATLLRERYGLAIDIFMDKQLDADGAGRPCPTGWITELAANTKAVLVASGD